MSKSMRVTLVFEFDGIEDANSEEATSIIEGINDPKEIMTMALAYGADHIWVDNAVVWDKEGCSEEDEVTFTWTIDDVMYEREDLSESQAREVLKAVKRNHDAEIGVNWDVIRTHADEMFPVEDEA